MPRAQFRDTVMLHTVSGSLAVPSAGALAALYEVGTDLPIGDTLYADANASQVLPNPLAVDADGVIDVWMDTERMLDVVISAPGFSPQRSTVTSDSAVTVTQGPSGDQGFSGEAGPEGPQGTSIVWMGEWSPTTSYSVDNTVGMDGSSWLCIAPIVGGSGPPTDPLHWALMAAAGVSDVPGPVGPQGDTGPVGPTGPQGDTGVQGPPGGAPSWQGEWVSTTDYANNDAVSLNGSSFYAAGNPPLGVAPPAAPWQQIAAKGDTGPTGPQGPIGNTGAQGPIGNTGAQGPIGNTGPQGPIGNTGPIGPQGVQGPAGTTGATGPQGPAWAPTPITITGSRHQIRNLPYVLDQLLTALANQGIIVNNTTP
jgi:hypothetical protein